MYNNMQKYKVELNYKIVVFTVFFLIFIFFLYKIRYVLLLLFIAVIFMSALSPIVDKLEKKKIPRGLGIFLLYIVIWTVISYGIASLVPPLVEQTGKFIARLPEDLEIISRGNFDLSILDPQINALPQTILQLAVNVFNNVIAIFTFMVILFYLILERRNLKKYLLFLFGDDDREKRAEQFIDKLEHKLGSWMRGQLALMIIVGLMSYVGLIFLGVDFAIPLAFLAGLLEIVPNIGPTLSMVPAILVALGSSPVLGLAVFALYFLIQQLENNFIVPKVMHRAVGLSPLVIILALMIGFKVAGIAGAVLSIPGVLLAEIIITDLYQKKNS